MKKLSDYTLPMRLLAQVPVLGALLFCLGKEQPNRSSKLAALNIFMLLGIVLVFAGAQGLLWSAVVLVGFIGLVLLAMVHNFFFGKDAKNRKMPSHI